MSIVFALTLTCALLFAARVLIGTWLRWKRAAEDEERDARWFVQTTKSFTGDLDKLLAFARKQDARVAALTAALERISSDADGGGAYLACSDLPACGKSGKYGHYDDCAVAIARAALEGVKR